MFRWWVRVLPVTVQLGRLLSGVTQVVTLIGTNLIQIPAGPTKRTLFLDTRSTERRRLLRLPGRAVGGRLPEGAPLPGASRRGGGPVAPSCCLRCRLFQSFRLHV